MTESWKLVPVEPTPDDMFAPVVSLKMTTGRVSHICGEDVIASGLWKAMLAAAPEPDDAVVWTMIEAFVRAINRDGDMDAVVPLPGTGQGDFQMVPTWEAIVEIIDVERGIRAAINAMRENSDG